MPANLESRFDRLQLFVPEGDRASKAIPVDLHDRWVVRLLSLCGDLFGGATSYGRGVGVWKSGRGKLWDRVTVVEVWAKRDVPDREKKMERLERRLREMGRALRQEAVAFAINEYLVFLSARSS
ncbi:MAG: hypothetical protein HY720_26060 [Planctomycetes bacterium]|nr:hypothetical protein [Planctomycetota bacterium]